MNNISSLASEFRILLVDDTPINLAVLKEALASENYKLAFNFPRRVGLLLYSLLRLVVAH